MTAPTFEVAPNHVQTLEFGTCAFSFLNVSPQPESSCWQSFVSIRFSMLVLA